MKSDPAFTMPSEAVASLEEEPLMHLRSEKAAELIRERGSAVLPVIYPVLREWLSHASFPSRHLLRALSGVGEEGLPCVLLIAQAGAPMASDLLPVAQKLGGPGGQREAHLLALRAVPRSERYEYVRLAIETDDAEFHEEIRNLAGAKQSTVRKNVAAYVAAIRPELATTFLPLLSSEQVTDRQGGVSVLIASAEALDASVAVEPLLQRLSDETDATTRTSICTGLLAIGVPVDRVRSALPPRPAKEQESELRKVKKLPGTFLDETTLPPLFDAAGEPIPFPTVRWLLHRQSKEPNPQPDVEALDAYDVVDRSTSGDFAIHVLEAALAAKPTKRTAWSFITAGMLGDRRVVAALSAQLPNWIKKNKNALPEFAAAALGLVGDDFALSVLVGLADDHREPAGEAKRLLRDTAERALAAAAAERGIPREELDEAVLPAFGFPISEGGSARVIPAGHRTIAARIGADFKLTLTDAGTGRRAASVPKAAGEEVQAEFKGLRKILAGVFKRQTRRLERLMVDGHAWDAVRWSQRFLGHPVLVPFSQRLVWGVLDEAGTGYAALFRGLGDGTLTDADDEPVERPTAGRVAIAHPARMTAEQLEAWTGHATDYEVEQPFEQLHRFTASVSPELRDALADPRSDNGELNAFSLRGKLQKHGWTQQDTRWTRRFPADGVTAALGVGGNGYDFFYLGPDDAVTTGPLSFERAGEPVPLGGVPPVAYSEAAGLVLRTLGRGP